MKTLIDTNILISSILSQNSTPFKAFVKAVTYPNQGMVCDQNLDEQRRIINRKFPQKVSALDTFLASALLTLTVVPMSEEESEAERHIRDVMDRPILRAALSAEADILLTGDKDFLESPITHPKIMTASDFLQYNS